MKKFLFLAVSCLFFACGAPPAKQAPIVLVSLAPYHHFAKKIVGDLVDVQTIVPQSANPHAYEPTMSQMREMKRGAVWFRIGEFFEDKLLPTLKEHNPDLVTVDLRKSVALIRHGCSCCPLEDHHIWLSPKYAIAQVKTMEIALSQKFPKHAEIFAMNAATYIQELELLDRDIREITNSIEERSFFVAHTAFAYFCGDYNFNQISLEFQGKEPTAYHLEQTLAEMKTEKTSLAIAMPQHSNKGLLLIAEKHHLRVRTIDPYAENVDETLRLLANTLAER
jgi:zinc transport system substrate-binding protein